MDRARFAVLADAYGGDLARWPEPERVPARERLAAEPELGALLDTADALDALLDSHRVTGPGAAMIAQAIAAATPPFGPVAVTRKRLRLWWAALGLAGVGVAGAATGAVAAAYVPATTIAVASATAFTDVDASEGAE